MPNEERNIFLNCPAHFLLSYTYFRKYFHCWFSPRYNTLTRKSCFNHYQCCGSDSLNPDPDPGFFISLQKITAKKNKLNKNCNFLIPKPP
jgi:hypothetical protein